MPRVIATCPVTGPSDSRLSCGQQNEATCSPTKASGTYLDHNPFDLIEADLIAPTGVPHQLDTNSIECCECSSTAAAIFPK